MRRSLGGRGGAKKGRVSALQCCGCGRSSLFVSIYSKGYGSGRRGRFNLTLLFGKACDTWILINSPRFRIITYETVNFFFKFGQRIKGKDENV
jgi:hypothetical protein